MIKKGFTLIELLIVVAIIAILAAIAVPNFLEAQTRAKVSRVLSDMRSLAVGIESYAVDHNQYPLGYRAYALWVDQGTIEQKSYFGLSLLTTPVAYIQTLPKDPFIDKSGRDDGSKPGYPPVYETFGANQWGFPGTSWGSNAVPFGYKWALYSQGPSRHHLGHRVDRNLAALRDVKWNGLDYFNPYDATNGTKSTGYIMTTNKGHFPD